MLTASKRSANIHNYKDTFPTVSPHQDCGLFGHAMVELSLDAAVLDTQVQVRLDCISRSLLSFRDFILLYKYQTSMVTHVNPVVMTKYNQM